MHTRKGIAKLENFRILLDSGYSSTVLMRRLVHKQRTGKDTLMQWQTQARNITTILKVIVYITLPALSATNVMMWKYHVDDSVNGRYDMILGRYIY